MITVSLDATGAPLLPATSRGRCYATTAHGPDLFAAAQGAIRYMIDHMVATRELSRDVTGVDRVGPACRFTRTMICLVSAIPSPRRHFAAS